MAINTNQKAGSAVLSFSANGGIVSVASLATPNTSVETVSAATLTEVVWGASGSDAKWTISRGSNTVLTLTGTGSINFREFSIQVEKGGEAAANLSVALSGTTPTGHIFLRLHKKSVVPSSDYNKG